jgi:hypothetical protein
MASVEELIVKITADNSDLKNKMSESGKSVDKFGGMVSKLGPMIAGALSVGAVVAFGKASVAAFESSERANRRLMFALNGNKAMFDSLTNQASKIQSATGIDEESIMQIQMLGSASGKSTAEIKKLVEASVELAAATGTDLQSAYLQLNKSFNGTVGRLAMVDADFSKLTEEELKNGAAIDLVIKKYKGLAAESATTVSKLSANWGEFQENFGSVIAPGINVVLEDLNERMRALTRSDMGFWTRLAAAVGPYGEILNAVADAQQAVNDKTEQFANLLPEVEITVSNSTEKISGPFELLNNKISETETKIKDVLATGGIISPQMYADLEAYRKQVENVNAALRLNEAYQGGRASSVAGLYGSGMASMGSGSLQPTKDPTNELAAQNAKRLSENKRFQEAMLQMNQEWANRQYEIETTLQLNKMDLIAGSMGHAAALFGEQTAAYRILASGSAMIATWAAASAALAPPPIGYGPAIGPFAVAGIIASGLANVAKINGVGMAEGGIVPPGFPNDSYGPVFLTSGEQVTPPGKLPNGGKTEVFGRLRAGDIYLSNKRGAYLMNRRG